jgi:hypothetical protein
MVVDARPRLMQPSTLPEWENMPSEKEIKENAGFVYKITHLETGRYYIGKKMFTAARTRELAKRDKEGKVIKDEKKKKVKDRVESDWKTYWGSSQSLQYDLQKYGHTAYKREIIQLAPTKGTLSYYELQHQMAHDVLRDPLSYNGIVNVRLSRNIFAFEEKKKKEKKMSAEEEWWKKHMAETNALLDKKNL